MDQLILTGTIFILFSLFKADPGNGEVNRKSQVPGCTDCHSYLVVQEVMHPVAEDACDHCHQALGGDHPEEGIRGFELMDAVPDLCFYCHEEPASMAHRHSPYSSGECLSCHDAHGSTEMALLKLPEKELCLSCHNREYRSDSSGTENIGERIAGDHKEHSAITGGGCTQCHVAHGSEFRALLVEDFPEDDYVESGTEQFPLCFLCHDTDLLDAGQTEWGTGFRNGTRNLHRLHMEGNKARNCRLCHEIHGSGQSFLVRERVKFGNWEMKMNFIPVESGGSCLPGCHGYRAYKK